MIRRAVIKSGKHLLRALSSFQARHSRIAVTPFLPNDSFPWTDSLAAATPQIDAELEPLLQDLDAIPAFHEVSPDQKRISRGENWKTFVLYVFGERVHGNCERAPETARILAALPGMKNAWFSILAPGYHIPPHRGPTRALVRCHLGLRVPQDAAACWIRVDQERRHWQQGEVMLFDDTYEHEVHNETDERRVVLFIDIERPSDGIGTAVNRLLLRAISLSTYVREPRRRLAEVMRPAAGKP